MAVPRITPYQADILVDARRLAGRDGRNVIDSRNLRSKTATDHLIYKGYMVDVEPYIGPRGGVYRRFILTGRGLQYSDNLIYRRNQKVLEMRRANAASAARREAEAKE
jgi:hypothetical protein